MHPRAKFHRETMSLQQLGRERFEVCHKRRRSWILLFRLYDGHSSDVWLSTLCHNANHKKTCSSPVGNGGAHVPNESGNVIFHSTTDPIRLVQEKLPVAERCFGILINSHDDGLDVVVAPAFAWS